MGYGYIVLSCSLYRCSVVYVNVMHVCSTTDRQLQTNDWLIHEIKHKRDLDY